MREWIAKNVLGLVRAPEAKIIDIFAELANGKSIALDSGAQSPIQDYIRNICASAQYVEKIRLNFVTAVPQKMGTFGLDVSS